MKKRKLFQLDEKLKKLDELTNLETDQIRGGATPTPTFKVSIPPTPPPYSVSGGPGGGTITGTIRF